MPAVSTAALARRLRSLDDAELAAFVADLWGARGFETTVDGTVVVAERPAGVDRERVACGPVPEDEPVDTVIAVSSTAAPSLAPDARVLGPGDLRDMLLYAVDRETADDLAERHFGRSLAVEPAGALGRRRLPLPSRRLAAAALAVVLALGLVLGATGGAPTFAGGSASAPAVPVPPDATPTPSAPSTSPLPVVLTPDDRPQGGGDLFRYPPGVGPSGVTNASALAAAHRSVLAETPWVLAVTHEGSFDLLHPFVRWTAADQRVVRTGPAHYRFEVTGEQAVENGSIVSVTFADYGDGSANYRRILDLHFNAYERTQLPSEGPPGVFATVSAAYVGRYLETTETRVGAVRVANTTRTRVVATGRPTRLARTVANYTAVAVVDRRGVVRDLRVEYTLLERVPDPTPNGIATPYASPEDVATEPVGTVRFRMTLSEVGTARVAVPSWYGTARNATNASGLPPWPNDPAV